MNFIKNFNHISVVGEDNWVKFCMQVDIAILGSIGAKITLDKIQDGANLNKIWNVDAEQHGDDDQNVDI